MFQFFTCKRNWYQLFTHVGEIGTNSSHSKKQVTDMTNTYQYFTRQKLSTIFSHDYELVPILRMCEELVPVLHTRDKVAPVLHRYDEYIPILHTSEIINMRNLCTNIRPQNQSKLTIRKFHICQMFVCLFVLLLYVPSQQLWSWRDGQFTLPHFFHGQA